MGRHVHLTLGFVEVLMSCCREDDESACSLLSAPIHCMGVDEEMLGVRKINLLRSKEFDNLGEVRLSFTQEI